MSSLPALLQHNCLACGFLWAMPAFDGQQQPLATLAWPESAEASLALARFSLYFVRCVRCGHIYNRDFSYAEVPYIDHPNRMYNASPLWQAHTQHLIQKLRAYLPANPVVVEIGCGEGAFLQALAEACPSGRFIGFDPNQNPDHAAQYDRIERRAELFVPAQHMADLRPDLVLSRHVLEHLMNPLAFVQEIAFYSAVHGIHSSLCFEVPCIDRVLAYGRIEDLYYEHNSHFTQHSFRTLLSQLPGQVRFVELGYNDEVIYGLVSLEDHQTRQLVSETLSFTRQTECSQAQVHRMFLDLDAGAPVVVWGGTGKAAAFIHHFRLTQAHLYVVDSDSDKVGTFVPGTAYKIHDPQTLEHREPAHIVIPPQWRAHDIYQEIERRQLPYQALWIEHQGQLVDFLRASHPYHNPGEKA